MERAAGIEKVFEHFPQAGRDSLIPILQAVQEAQGYLSEIAVVRISRHLGIPASKVYGVATFYNQFRFQPKGKYHILVCRGTACHVKGSGKVLDAVVKHLKIEPGKTTRDKMFSLETVACMGACALSPVICINEDFYAKVSPAKVIKLIESYREKELAQAATA
jgi:NADH-quinone oxidoreductase E subunit